jgi:hypothetical protein
MLSLRCPPIYQFTVLHAYPPCAERGSGLSQAVSHQILTAGIGVFSRTPQGLLMAVKWYRLGYLRVLPFPLPAIIPPMFYIHMSSSELVLGSLVAANQKRLRIMSSYGNTDEVAGKPASCPGAEL